MNGLASAAIVAALLGVALFGWCWRIRRVRRAGSERDRIVREAHEQARAAALLDGRTLAEAAQSDRLPAEVEDHLMHFILNHPDVADGFARLAQAARDEHTNKPEGD